jgi:hypothetical protein
MSPSSSGVFDLEMATTRAPKRLRRMPDTARPMPLRLFYYFPQIVEFERAAYFDAPVTTTTGFAIGRVCTRMGGRREFADRVAPKRRKPDAQKIPCLDPRPLALSSSSLRHGIPLRCPPSFRSSRAPNTSTGDASRSALGTDICLLCQRTHSEHRASLIRVLAHAQIR